MTNTVDVFGCHCLGPPDIPIGGIGPPGPKLLFGGGPRIPGPYEFGIGPIPGPRGGFIRGLIPIPGGPPKRKYILLSVN